MIGINLPEDKPYFTVRVTLDEREYSLGFKWNQRSEKWYVSVADAEGTQILAPVKLVADWPINLWAVGDDSPPGWLMWKDDTGQGLDPYLDDLATRGTLIYFTEAEIAA
jgi:hypothetical protein